jgi:hypothetical protein
MTISTSASAETVLGNGSTTVWSFNFVVGLASNLNVYYTNGTTTTLLSPSQYTLNLTAAVTGQIWGVGGTVTYPTAGSPIANGTSLTFSRIVPLTQLTSISNQGALLLQSIESAMDTLCLEIQQVSSKTGQFRGTWLTGTAYNYGDVVQDGANGANSLNYYMCSIANTAGTWSTDLGNGDWQLAFNTAAVIGYSNSAASSATAAAASAATASTGATTATTEAGIATTQAGIATTQASAASTSATNAATSATSASTSATNAAASATTASTGATTATTQAGIATTQASAASTSATNAATSATAAAASAVLAGSTFTATSTTSNTIGTGNFTFTTQANKNFIAGQNIIAASNANGANYIHGYVASYSGTTLVITETDNGGTGAHTDWNIGVSGTQGTSGTGYGTVTSVSVASANGFTGTVANPTTTPAITIVAGAITPTSVASTGAVSGTTITGSSTVQGTQLISTIATGTAPLTVASTTQVANLNAATAGNATTVTNGVYTTDTGTVTNTMLAGSIALTKLANQAADTFLANATSGSAAPTAVALAASQLAGRGATGDIAAIALGTGLSMSGTTLNATGGSELVLLGSAVASTSASLTFTSLISSSYSAYILVFNDLLTSTTATVNLKTSSNNGSTYANTFESQKWNITLGNTTAPAYTDVSGSTPALLTTSQGSAKYNGRADFVITATVGALSWESTLSANGGGTIDKTFLIDNSGNATNAFELLPSAGTFTSGTVYLYGVKNT